MSDENLKMAFSLFDTDGDGKINCSEFYHVISDCSQKKIEHTRNHHGCETEH